MAGRETIRQRIALEGGEAIQEALKSLGEAGEKAFKAIQDAAEKAGAAKPLENLSKTIVIIKDRMRDLGDAAKRVQRDFRAFGTSLNAVGSSFGRVVRNIGLVTAAVGAAAAGFFAFVKAGSDAADAIGKQSQALGLNIDEYQRLKFALGQSGVSAEEFTTAMSILNRQLGKIAGEGLEGAVAGAEALGVTVRRYGAGVTAVAQDTNNAGTAFVKLGLKTRDANGNLRSTEDLLLDMAESFSKMPDGAGKSALALELFGRSGAQLIPFLNEGRAGVQKLFETFEKLGLELTEGDVVNGEAFGDALDRIGEIATALQVKLSSIFSPALTEAADQFTQLIADNADAIQAFTRDIAAQAIPAMKDLINTLLGNDAAVVNQRFIEWRESAVAFGRGVQDVAGVIGTAFAGLLAVFNSVSDGLNAVFGTEFSGGALLAGAAILQLLGVFKLLFSTVGLVGSGVRLLVSGFLALGPAIALASGFFSALVEGAVLFTSLIAGLIGWPALLAAAAVAAGVLIVVFWEDISKAAQATWDFITGLFNAAGFAQMWSGLAAGAQAALDATLGIVQAGIDGIASILSGIGGIAATAFAGITTAAQFVIDGVTTIFNAGAAIIGGIWQGISDTVAAIWDSTAAGIAAAAQGITDAIAAASQMADADAAAGIAAALVAPFQLAAQTIGNIWAGVEQLTKTGFDGIFAGANAAVTSLGNVAKQISSRLRSDLDGLIATLNAAMTRIIASINRAIARLKAAAAEARSSGGSSDQGFARGGYVRGPGTATSDSIPARLSNGEFVVRSAAVRKYGVAFMRMINGLRVNSSQLAGMIPGFAQGGLVGDMRMPDMGELLEGLASVLGAGMTAPSLAIAGGGSVQSRPNLRPINLTLPGGESFDMLAPEDVAQKVMRFATGSALRSAGQKPGWYR